MRNIVTYFIIGIIASLVPLNLIGLAKEKDPSIDINYYQMVRYAPIVFGIFNVIFLSIINKFFPKLNYFIVGAMAAIIISSYGRFVQNIPTKVFKMKNPNMFHVNAVITWSLFYGIVVNYLLKV